MPRTADEVERKLLEVALRMYHRPEQRVAMRGALGDAASLLDAMADEVGNDGRVRGRIKKEALAQSVLLSRAADRICAMRDKIEVNS